MYTIKFEPMGLSVEADPEMSIGDAAARRNIPIRFDCGGKGVCGKCRVIVEPAENIAPPTETELKELTAEQIAEGHRLACQAQVCGPIRVTVPEQLTDSREARGKDGITGAYAVDPLVERLFLPKAPMPEPTEGISGSLADWLADRARTVAGHEVCFRDPGVLRQVSLPGMVSGDTTLVHHARNGVTAVLSGHRPRRLGVAFDIGTTTVAAYLCDMESGQVLNSVSAINPQRRYGEDVISRIAHANEQETGLKSLQTLITESVNDLIGRCLEQAGASREDVDEVTVVGNTTMEQIFAGFHPNSLGVSPYLPTVRDFPDFRAADLGLDLNPGTGIHLFPVISGFVGGDTLSATLADGPYHRDESCLIVDIGTNGELVLSNGDKMWATSCATGPALEGAQISCGMRAVSGAIYKVESDADGQVRCRVLGDEGTKPVGLCGSGIIDAIAVLRQEGIIETSGRFKADSPGVVCDEKGLGRKFVLVPADQTASGTEIVITLKDVRQIQLAKSALAVGIEFLMRKAGLERVDRTVLTGAFGARFDWRNAALIGMLPPNAVSGKVLPKENLAGVGAIMALLNKTHRAEAAELGRGIRFIELAGDADFAMRFALGTAFPDPDEVLPPN